MASNYYRKGEEIRGQIVAAASQAFQKQGFGNTSFHDLARQSGVPKGNFYHYFRSKDDVLDAVIDDRLSRLDAQIRRLEESSPDPRRRVCGFIKALLNDADDPFVFGCPHGSLCAELAKARPDLLARGAETLDRLRRWFAEQFRLGDVSGNSDHLALRLLARMQGIVLVGATFRDRAFIRRETQHAQEWVNSLPPARSMTKRPKTRRRSSTEED